MPTAKTQSPADDAFSRFRIIKEARKLFRIDETLSESDTRSKLIDPLFKTVLGWHEAEIRREKQADKGFIDYVIGADFAYLLIEAKRVAPRFQLSAPSKPRRLKLSGPHLLENRKLRPHIEQAQAYSSSIGVQFCVVTNGQQFILFRPFLPGRSWRTGSAIVYHDHGDIEQNFAEFFDLLHRDRVVSGSLVEAFEELEQTTTPHYTVLEHLPDAEKELIRNRVWRQIAQTLGPLLTDQLDDPATQLEIIRNCYVTTPIGDQTDSTLDTLLRDLPEPRLQDAAVVDLKIGAEGKTAFSHRLEADVKLSRPGTYILTGGVGSGKTTFLRRFASIVDPGFVERFTVWIHIDFLPIGNVDPAVVANELRGYAHRVIRNQLESRFGEELSSTGEKIRELFSEEIESAGRTTLFGVADGTPEWTNQVNQLVHGLFNDTERYSFAALRALRRRGRRIAIVLDNTDQLGEHFQEQVFLFAQKLSADYAALCVVALREEKFFAAYRRGIFDAFSSRRFHIGSPDLRSVLRKRLEYGRKKFADEASREADGIDPSDVARIDALLGAMIVSTTGKNANIVRMLASVSNGDMRYALDMFREFLSSGNTNVEKILNIIEREGGYTVPFHEFAKSAILGSRKYYRSSVSHIVNLFKKSDAQGASHLTACRLLARLSGSSSVASPHGEGFVATTTLLREFRESFGFAEDLLHWLGELQRRNLVESEPPRVGDPNHADAYRITAAGAYYWRYLVRSFAYVDLVFVDTPLSDRDLIRRLVTMADMSDMTVRYERVRTFLSHLADREKEELAMSAARVGPFQEPLMAGIQSQIETEIRGMAKRTGKKDVFGARE